MQSLTIKDLPISEQLDSKAMRAVRGGNGPGADKPSKYDVLIGDAILHGANGAVSAYSAVPVQGMANLGDAASAVHVVTQHSEQYSYVTP